MSFKYSADGQYIQTSFKANIKEKKSLKLVNQLLGLEEFSDDENEHFDSVNINPINNYPLHWFSMDEEARRALEVNPPILNYNDAVEEGVISETVGFDTSRIVQTYASSKPISSSHPLNFVPDRISPLSPASVNGAVLSNCCNGTTFQKCLENEPESVCMQNCKNICPLKF